MRLATKSTALALLALALAGCTSATPVSTHAPGYAYGSDQLVVGLVSGSNGDGAALQPLLDYLAKVTGKKVQVVEALNYSDLAAFALKGQIDLGRFSAPGYLAATDAGAHFSAIAQPLPPGASTPDYLSVGVVPAGSPVASPADLRGKTVCFVAADSTAGYLYPSYALQQAGIDPEKGIVPVFTDTAERVVQSVTAGQCDAGFVGEWGTDASVLSDAVGAGKLRVFSTASVPVAVFAESTTLPKTVRADITNALTGLSAAPPATRKALEKQLSGMVAVSPTSFDGIRSVCAATLSELCRYAPDK